MCLSSRIYQKLCTTKNYKLFILWKYAAKQLKQNSNSIKRTVICKIFYYKNSAIISFGTTKTREYIIDILRWLLIIFKLVTIKLKLSALMLQLSMLYVTDYFKVWIDHFNVEIEDFKKIIIDLFKL